MPSLNNILRGNIPGLNEIAGLVNLLPEPCLIHDTERDQVLLGNSAFLKVTAFSQKDIGDIRLGALLDDSTNLPTEIGIDHSVSLRRRNRQALPMTMRMVEISPGSPWFLISFDSILAVKDPVINLDNLFKAYFKLVNTSESASLQELLIKSIEITKALLNTELCCIFQAESEYPELKKVAYDEPHPVFPDAITSADLGRLTNTSVWTPGKRVFTEVHRAGRVANLTYVASTPLGQEEGMFGLLVVGSTAQPPSTGLQKLLGIVGAMLSDIIQRKILLANLYEENMSLRRQLAIRDTFVESTQEGILAIDPEFNIIEVNPAAEMMLGYTDWEVKGLSIADVLIGPDNLVPVMEAVCRNVPASNLGTISLHRRDGQTFPAQMQIIPVQQDGALVALLIFIMDVSSDEKIRLHTQHLEHRAVLGEFTAIFAHEVRNPINSISTGLQLLASRLDDDSPNQNVINRMLGDCTRIDHLMESVLSYSRPLEAAFNPLDINQFLQRILDRWHPRLTRLNVKPFIKPDPELPLVLGDSRSLEQVFMNLISNAVEAMREKGGTLAIRTSSCNVIANRPQVEITLSDDGLGIPDEIREHIFEPFVTNNPRGTGLGLAITKRVITAHQGSISVNSFPGGTVFHVYLPVANHGEPV